MTDVADYDTDILLWSERQAALLRDLKTRASGLSNELDLETVAEEIESVGKSELAAVRSLLRNILKRLVKVASRPDADAAGHWLSEIRTFRSEIADRITPSMMQNIDIQKSWRQAIRDGGADLAEYGDVIAPLPDVLPFGVADIASDDFDPKAAVARLALTESAASEDGRRS